MEQSAIIFSILMITLGVKSELTIIMRMGPPTAMINGHTMKMEIRLGFIDMIRTAT